VICILGQLLRNEEYYLMTCTGTGVTLCEPDPGAALELFFLVKRVKEKNTGCFIYTLPVPASVLRIRNFPLRIRLQIQPPSEFRIRIRLRILLSIRNLLRKTVFFMMKLDLNVLRWYFENQIF
jgi:hypothetical protein